MRIMLMAGTALLVAGCATNPGDQRAVLMVSMSGIQEVPGPGDPDGTARSKSA